MLVRRLQRLSLAVPAALLLLPFVLIVTLGGLWIALHGENLLEPGSSQLFVGLENFKHAISDATLRASIKVTVIYVVAAVACETILGVGVALLMWRHFWGKGIVRSLVLIPMVLTPVVAGLTWRLLMDPTAGTANYLLGLLGLGSDHAFLADPSTALAAVILVDVWQNTPYVVIIVLAGLESLPAEPFEAAQLDGATGWKLLRNVTLPLLGPVLSIVVLLRTIDAVKTFALTQTMTKGGPGTSTLAISNYVYRVGFETFDIGYSSALGLVTSIALVVLIFPFARRLMTGGRPGPARGGRR
ncbi:carbohydrate ABC transporter permease [Kribbella sindirgiensis]|uniref:Sugar ABC transporter permease n=1 Tax=Kribbella sindirgiensis TaxID=1124744 RepID=A0A4V2M3I6_9ACTN|nr:sugar ABC transporter permease [Kribbella sindirgiensis]TCC32222.1 sugar ABC transporter permease [Kribbella sindirgiensis]